MSDKSEQENEDSATGRPAGAEAQTEGGTPQPEGAGESATAGRKAGGDASRQPPRKGKKRRGRSGSDKPAQPPAETGTPAAGNDGTAGGGRGWAGAVLGLLILVVAGAGAAGGYHLWQQLQAARQEATGARDALAGRLAELEDARATLAREARAAREAAADAQSRQQALESALSDLRRRLGDDGTGWVVAEAEYLLRIANRRLTLERDVATARAALQAADARLRSLGEPAYLPVREAVAEEIAALEAVPQPDIAGLTMRLASLAGRTDTLALPHIETRPPGSEQPTATAAVEDWRGFLTALWADLRSLVTIRHERPTGVPLMPPEQQTFLRQNLRLKLETARLTLLQRRPEAYRATLDEVLTWLDRYFVTDSSDVQAMRKAVTGLREVEVAPELPDISGSLRRLKAANERIARGGDGQ